MSIWNRLKNHAGAQFLDVIEWMEDDRNTLVWRFPVFGQAIQDGGRLVVREGQAAIFQAEGQISDVFGPGTYELSTRTKAITGFFETIKYGLNYPYKGDVFFMSTRQFTDQKWGTPNPIMLRDQEFGAVRIRAFGVYAYRINDPAKFLRELVGNTGLFETKEINGQLKRKLVSGFADTVGEANKSVLDLAAHYMDIGDTMRDRLSGWFESNYGIKLTDFVIENISLPPNVEKMLDKRTSMGIIGDMGAYSQFQAANAIETAAAQPGGGGNPMLQAGMGLAMGNVMGQQMMHAQQGRGAQFNPQHGMSGGTPPPPPQAQPRYHYNGPSGAAQLTAQEVAQKVAQNRTAQHHLWMNGWPGWKPWSQVQEVAALVPPAAPPPPPASSVFHYSGPGGQAQLSAQQVAQRVAQNPSAQHMVWKEGFSGWQDARTVAEITAASSPAGGGPPPPPM